MTDSGDRLTEIEAQIERLRARLTDIELALAHMRGTLSHPTPDDAPAVVAANYPPSAPPHNEKPSIGRANE